MNKYGKVIVFTKQKGKKTDWCAFTKRTGKAKGVAGKTFVRLIPCYTGCNPHDDSGKYKYYAGPVKWNNKQYIRAGGHVKYDGKTYYSLGMELAN